MTYRTDETDPHLKAEETQWSGILSSGNETAGMILIFIQKLCTAFHELEPAYKAGALNEESLEFLKSRMLMRIDKVLDAMKLNSLEDLNGFSGLKKIRAQAQESDSLKHLAGLTDAVHDVNHILCDSLIGD